MSKLSDHRNRSRLSQFADEEIELVLTSGMVSDPDLDDLASFLADIREEVVSAPTPAEVDRFARRAAAIVRSTNVPARPETRPGQKRISLTALRTHAATAVATAALAIFSALGLTANAAVPGDVLYGLDLAMESVGIGNGSLQERLDEATVLIDRDDQAGAIELLSSSISGNPDADADDLSAAVDALTELRAVQDNNAGGNSENNAGGNPDNNAGGNPDNNAGGNPDNNAGGNPDNNAGGNPDNNAGGNPDNNAGGNPENNAGGNSENNAGGNSDNNAGGNSDNNAGGNSENNAGGNSDNNAGGNSDNNAGGSPDNKGKSGD